MSFGGGGLPGLMGMIIDDRRKLSHKTGKSPLQAPRELPRALVSLDSSYLISSHQNVNKSNGRIALSRLHLARFRLDSSPLRHAKAAEAYVIP